MGASSRPYLTPGKYSLEGRADRLLAVEQKNIDVRLGTASRAREPHPQGRRPRSEVVEGGRRAGGRQSSRPRPAGSSIPRALSRLPIGRNFTDTLYLVPGVSDSRRSGTVRTLHRRRQRPGEQLRRRRSQHHGHRASAPSGVYNIDLRLAGQRRHDRLHQGDPGEDGRLRGRIRPGHRRRRERRHAERQQRVPRQPSLGYIAPVADLESDWRQPQATHGTVNTTGRQRFRRRASSLGGPLMKDKLFFFGTFNPQFQHRHVHRAGAVDTGQRHRPSSSANAIRHRHPEAQGLLLRRQADLPGDAESPVRPPAVRRPSTGESGLQRFSTLRRVAYAGVPGTTRHRGRVQRDRIRRPTTRRCSYDGIISRSWLIEASVGHSTNKFDETSPSPTSRCSRMRPQRSERTPRRHRLRTRTTTASNFTGDLEVHEHLHRRRQPPAPLWRRVRGIDYFTRDTECSGCPSRPGG